MTTYCRNDELFLDTGQSIDDFFKVGLTDIEKTRLKINARQRAFEFINSKIEGRTALPAYHIPSLVSVEKDLVIADMIAAAFSMNTANTSDWEVKYRERANNLLEKLRFCASSEDSVPDSQNVGNGYLSEVRTNDDFTMKETWVLKALNAAKFSVHGSLHEWLREAEVGQSYPLKDWTSSMNDYGITIAGNLRYEEFPISFKIVAGTVPFVDGDRFIFRTYSASFFKQRVGSVQRG